MNHKIMISEQRAKAMVIMNIINNCTIDLDNTGQVCYSMDEKQFGKVVDTLVKNINVIQNYDKRKPLKEINKKYKTK